MEPMSASTNPSPSAEPLFAVPLQPTPAKLSYLLDRLCEHRPWFNDFLWEDPAVRRRAASGRLVEGMTGGAVWEVYRGADLVGIFLMDRVVDHTEASCHFVFFDRTLGNKAALCRDMMAWAFATLDLHLLRVEIPTHIRPLLKFVRKLGFRYEAEGRSPSWPRLTDEWADARPLTERQATLGSRKHHTMLYEGVWRDSLLLSLTREEFARERSIDEAGRRERSTLAGVDQRLPIDAGQLHERANAKLYPAICAPATDGSGVVADAQPDADGREPRPAGPGR